MPHDIGDIKESGITNYDYFRSDSVLSQFIQERDSQMEPLISAPITIEGIVNNISIDIAFQYISANHEDLYSFVNNKKTLSVGSHIDGLLYAILREFTLNDHSKGWYNE